MTESPVEAWEPGAPSARAIAPSLIAGVAIPLAVYFTVRRHVSSDATALVIAGTVPATWVAVQWVRTRRVDIIGAITLFGFLAGVAVSQLLGGNAFVLKVRDSAFTTAFGIACLISLRTRRPMMFYIGKALSCGDDPRRRAAYDELYEIEEARRVFALITACWGIGLILDAAARVLLAAAVPTGTFLIISPVLAFFVFGGLFVFTGVYSRRARAAGEAELAAQGMTYPSVAAS